MRKDHKVILIVFMIFLAIIQFSCSSRREVIIRYGGQYYPEEFLLTGHDFFTPLGLQVEHTIFSSGTENTAALIRGDIDICVASDTKTIELFNAMGQEVVILGTVQRGNRYSTVVPVNSVYSDWSELKGRKVGTRFGTGAEYVLHKFFASRDDLDWGDYEWVNIKTENMIQALANGEVEAITVWSPTGEIAEAQGVGRLLMNYGEYALTPVCIHARSQFVKKQRGEVVKFLAAHLQKANLIKNDPQQAAALAAAGAGTQGIEVPAAAFELIFQRVNFQIDFGEEIITELQNTANSLKELRKIDRIPELYWDKSLLEEAEEMIRSER